MIISDPEHNSNDTSATSREQNRNSHVVEMEY